MRRLAVCVLPVLQIVLLVVCAFPDTIWAKDQLPDFVELSKKFKPSVVNIGTSITVKPRRQFQRPFNSPFSNDPFEDFFDSFMGNSINMRTNSGASVLVSSSMAATY